MDFAECHVRGEADGIPGAPPYLHLLPLFWQIGIGLSEPRIDGDDDHFEFVPDSADSKVAVPHFYEQIPFNFELFVDFDPQLAFGSPWLDVECTPSVGDLAVPQFNIIADDGYAVHGVFSNGGALCTHPVALGIVAIHFPDDQLPFIAH